MGLLEKAKAELAMAGLLSEAGDFYGGSTGRAVLELLEVFVEQGHSGGSAPGVISIFSKLANHETLGPLTGGDEEWGPAEDWSGDDPTQQNLRDSRLFRHSDGRVTCNGAIVKRCPDGTQWSGPLYLTKEDAIADVNRLSSGQEIKGFPFTPKTFYIDVIEEEVKPDDWIMWCKDPSQLEQVWEHYKKPEFLNPIN